jgi:predicted DNA-binding transcriptional regulator AlpA
LLGHRSAKATERYAHLSSDPVKQAADRISSEIAELLGAQPVASDDTASNLIDASPEDLAAVRTILGRTVKARWLDTREVAARVNLTVATLQTYRWMGVGPPFRKIGGRVVYSADEVDAWKMTQATEEAEKVSGSGGPAY